VALSTTMVGDDDDRGRLKGRMKFALDGCRPKAFVMLGELKSSISLFRTIPSAVRTLEPQYRLTVDVIPTASPSGPTTEKCVVPGVSSTS